MSKGLSCRIMSQSDTSIAERTKPTTDQGDDDATAHIVMKDDQMKGYLTGKPIKALCGKVWTPTRDYEGLPVCQKCIEVRDRLIAGMNNLN